MPDPKSPAQHASDAAEAIRALNHATLSPADDWEYPSHAYDVIGGLERATDGLSQAIDQTRFLLIKVACVGSLGSTTGNAQQDFFTAHDALEEAAAAAAQLNAALQRAHNATSPLTYKED